MRTAIHCCMLRSLSILGLYLLVTEDWTNSLINGLVKTMQFCVSFDALSWQTGKFVHFQRGLFSDSHLWSGILGNDWRSPIPSTTVRDEIFAVTICDKVHNHIILEALNSEPLLLRVENSQLRWFRHVSRKIKQWTIIVWTFLWSFKEIISLLLPRFQLNQQQYKLASHCTSQLWARNFLISDGDNLLNSNSLQSTVRFQIKTSCGWQQTKSIQNAAAFSSYQNTTNH